MVEPQVEPQESDELWGLRDRVTGLLKEQYAYVSMMEAESCIPYMIGADTLDPVLIGVSPAIRDALRAEVAAKEAEIERLTELVKRVQEMWDEDSGIDHERNQKKNVRLKAKDARIAELEAENARLRGEGPIRVGDVVQLKGKMWPAIYTVTEVPDPDEPKFDDDGNPTTWGSPRYQLQMPDGLDGVRFAKTWMAASCFTRIGRVIRMPNGSPVEQPSS